MLRAGLFFCCFLLASCGFSTVSPQASPPVLVSPVQGHLGQLLRSDLEDRFAGNLPGDPYTLFITLEQVEVGRQAIQKDATPTRITTAITANYRLSYQGKDVLTDRSTFRGSSNVVDNPFASYTSSKTVEERLIHLIATDISTRLQAYFKTTTDAVQ